jgi:ABC-2 type transport system ATP-binding protein
VYGLVGPHGAGKSTLLSIVTGVRRADRGTVHIGLPSALVAVCPDVPEFEPWLTAYEVVDLARHYVVERFRGTRPRSSRWRRLGPVSRSTRVAALM